MTWLIIHHVIYTLYYTVSLYDSHLLLINTSSQENKPFHYFIIIDLSLYFVCNHMLWKTLPHLAGVTCVSQSTWQLSYHYFTSYCTVFLWYFWTIAVPLFSTWGHSLLQGSNQKLSRLIWSNDFQYSVFTVLSAVEQEEEYVHYCTIMIGLLSSNYFLLHVIISTTQNPVTILTVLCTHTPSVHTH